MAKKKCAMLIIKREKRETTEEIELVNQKSIRTFGEKENYKYLGILKADIIKLVEMEKEKKRVPQKNEKSFLKKISTAQISSREQTLESVRKVGDLSRRRSEGSLFNSYYTEDRVGRYSIPRITQLYS